MNMMSHSDILGFNGGEWLASSDVWRYGVWYKFTETSEERVALSLW